MQAMIYRKVPMRDGVHLATDIWLPDGNGPWPVVLVRTPYHRQGGSGRGKYFTDLGYAFVIQDTRGKYDSEGHFRPLDDDPADGHDTLDWIAEQSWCNGRIGMTGKSYLGMTQLFAAGGGHEALRCILPGVAPNSFFSDWIRYDGCFALANLVRWPLDHAICPTKPHSGHFTYDELWRIGASGSLADIEARVGFASEQLRKWIAHDHYDDYWASIDQASCYDKVACAGMHQGGFFDHISRGQFNSFKGIRAAGATEFARANQRLLVGAWGHGNCGATTYGDWDFGSAGGIDIDAYELRFLDLWLRDIDDGVSAEPAVKYFLMGENRWEHATDWPPPEARVQQWYLTSAGDARGLGSSGRLSPETPSGPAGDSYSYDPRNPVPTLGGPTYWGMSDFFAVGPVDQRPLLRRDDVLYYRSEPLARPLTVVGDINLELWIASSAPDTDFIAKLCVIEPIGRVTVLTHGSLRCRYRNSFSEPEALAPGEPTRLAIQMNNVAYTFPQGSRIGLIITSSCCPRILPHPNTMTPTWQETEPQTARQEILHDSGHDSCLLLPVIEG
jgi:uncharacterized protein